MSNHKTFHLSNTNPNCQIEKILSNTVSRLNLSEYQNESEIQDSKYNFKTQSVQSKKKTKMNPMQINEILIMILNKLKVHELIYCFRLVSSQWNSAIYEICKMKRNLMLYCVKDNNLALSNRFFGKIKLERFVYLKLKRDDRCIVPFHDQLCDFLGQLFPNVDQLVVQAALDDRCSTHLHDMIKNFWPNLSTYSLTGLNYSRIPYSDQINQLKSLKRLDLWGNFDQLPNLQLFSYIEHFSCFSLITKMPLLGSKCSSYSFAVSNLFVNEFDRWIQSNSTNTMNNLTHLGLSNIRGTGDGEFIRLICSKFPSLQVLSIKFKYWVKFNNVTCVQLAKLSHLTKLTLGSAQLDLESLENIEPQTQKLPSIRSLHLIGLCTTNMIHLQETPFLECTRFCCILAAIFPNIEQLAIYTESHFIHERIESNLNNCFRKVVEYKKLSDINKPF